MFFIIDDEVEYRIDKQDFGCTIKSMFDYIEGNESVYEILKEINDVGIESSIKRLSDKYSMPRSEIYNIYTELFENFYQEGHFKNIKEQIFILGTKYE